MCARGPLGLDDRDGLELFGPGRMSADRLVRRVVGERVPQRRPGRSRGRFVRLYGHRYPGDGQHVLLAVRAHERLDRSAAAGRDAALVRPVAAGLDAAGHGAAAVHLAALLHDRVQVAGRVRPALAAQRMAPAAGRHHSAAVGCGSGRQVHACRVKTKTTSNNATVIYSGWWESAYNSP